MGHMLTDLWLGLTTGKQGRMAMGLNVPVLIHHVLFAVAAYLNTTYNIFAPELVWLVLAELSTIFLILRRLMPSQRDAMALLFAGTFFVTRFPLYIHGCYHMVIRLMTFPVRADVPLMVAAF